MKKYTKWVSMVLILFLVLGLSSCAPATEEEIVPPDENTVIIEGYEYLPAEITIQAGETITWINKDSVKHNATDDTFNTGLLAKEESAQVTFEDAGTHNYHCTPHPYMKGTVIVE